GAATAAFGWRGRCPSPTSSCATVATADAGAPNGSAPEPGRARPLSLEQSAEMVVEEHTVRVESAAQLRDVVEKRVALAQLLRAKRVQLAPVRAAARGEEDRLQQIEVLAVLLAVVAVHGDVRAVAAVRGGQRDVVALGCADLQRERHPRAVAVDGAADLVEDLRQRLQRDGVLHLGKADTARRDEDLVGLVDVSAGGHRLRGEGVELAGQI